MDLIRYAISQFFGDPFTLALAILILPFTSFIVLFFIAHYLPRKGDIVATVLAGIAFTLSLLLFINSWGIEVLLIQIPWFKLSHSSMPLVFTASLKVNDLSVMMLLLVTFISFLVHLYSLEYMKGKKHYERYYPYLGLFTFSMIGIVLSNNLLVTFMFWELVGFSSYLLIGFWYEKESAMKAAKKAFLFNRIGDTGFILGIIAFFAVAGSFEISTLEELAKTGGIEGQILFWGSLGIFLGCVGKSAQFPLQAWLPDAMEGPTPVSALIHAATMVAAGVYLLIKVHVLLHADVLTIIAFVGAVTAFAGAVPALFQTDIKKVLAFSTISQLGYMIMAIGVNAYEASFFHLMTHGFFKACLFLSAGAVIHAMHEVKHELFVQGQYRDFDSQDMRLMGGFRKVMPITFICYFASAASLAGIPFFSGFLSKDAILEAAVQWASKGEGLHFIVPALTFATIFITALYMTRQLIMIFGGENRLINFYPHSEKVFSEIHEPGLVMKIPLMILAILSLGFAFSLNPFNAADGWFFKVHVPLTIELISIMLGLGGGVVGVILFRRFNVTFDEHVEEKKVSLSHILKNNWQLDSVFYYLLVLPGIKTSKAFAFIDLKVIDGIIHLIAIMSVIMGHIIAWVDKVFVDGIVNLIAHLAGKLGSNFRSIQNGKIQSYFVFSIFAAVILLIWIIIW